MNRVIHFRTIIMMLALILGAANEAWAADLTISDIVIEGGAKVGDTFEYTIDHGSVTVKEINNTTRAVTITVTPASGYFVNKSDIIVQKLLDPSTNEARRRTPDIADALTVIGPLSSSAPTDYTFVIPADYAGALVTITFTAKPLATATVTPNSLTYTGSPQPLVTLGTVIGGAATDPVTYSLSSDGTYTTTIPTGTDAGTYTVYYKVAGDAIHAEGSGSVTVTILKAGITSVELDNYAIIYDGSLHTVSVTSVKAGSLDVPSGDYTVSGNTATSVGTYTVTVTVKPESVNFTGSATTTFRIVETTTKIIYSNTSASEVSELNGHYLIMDNIGASVLANLYRTTQDFTGTLEAGCDNNGNFYKIDMNGYNHPLFNTVNGGVVKNVILDNVNISSSDENVGAIAGIAKGYSRIYNCGILPKSADFPNGTHPSVTTSGACAGGLVGRLEADSRVINCYSYADVSATTTAAGIVGNNTYASTAAETDGKYADLRTAVVNCMFYGDITGGTNRYPVYGGEKMVNNTSTGINNYDFYRAEASVGTLTDYNCSWPAKEEYLTRYEYYRYLLNSNRELCGWWVKSDVAPNTLTTSQVQLIDKDASLMAKWVLDTEIAPYPILKVPGIYFSPINIDASASWRTTANEWEGKNLGSIRVTINPGTHAAGGASTKSDYFVITDMDTLHVDYCYRKIQLPYYNTVFGNPNGANWEAKYGGNYGDYAVIGWEITTTDGADGTFTENWQDGYNFADRTSSNKDKYSVSGRVFAQGGYYYVPNDVTEITITAHWASAIYLDNTDHYYDRVSVSTSTWDNGLKTNVESSTLNAFAPAGTRPQTLGNGKTVQNGSISSKMPSSGSVYGNAVVLVGNHQSFTGGANIGSSSKGGTIMSADFDCDNEPDHCLIWQLGTKTNRQSICPIRFDFLPVVEMGMAMKEDGSTQYYSLGCYRPYGHFEVTETALIHFGQFEFSNVRTVDSPIILNGGIFDQYTKGTTGGDNASSDRITYIILGGNLKMPSFTPGSHVNSKYTYSTRHCAVNVLGGNIDCLYLTGYYNEGVTPNTDNPHCYIDGGRFKQVAAAGKEGIDGDVTFKINHSKIWEFYGGSTMDLSTGNNFKIVKGNIDVTIDNSIVDKYCGGPKFGDMESGKTVTTNANNTTFGVYYGGGNGGTSYVQYAKTDGEQTVANPFDWAGKGNLNGYTPGKYRDETTGYMADYELSIVNTSAGTNQNNAIYRSYFYAAQFSATNTGPITNNLTNCTVLTNFYGGGNLGGVKGNVTSTLDGTTHVYGSVFGAGFSASVPEVTIYNKDKTSPAIDVNTGIITPESSGTSTTYTWTHESSLGGQTLNTNNNPTVTVNGVKYLYTTKSLDNLGAVSGAVTLTIKGNTIVEGKVFKEDGTIDTEKIGGVYGGGDASAVTNTTTPANASTTVNLQENAQVYGNVFGGGNEGLVSGSAKVNIMVPGE